MAEQIKFKFELDSDETFDILKDIGEAENELGKQCWKDGLKAQAIEYFKQSCSYLIACIPNATKYCDQCGQRLYWKEK